MPLAKNVEKRIWDIEQFAVIIKHNGHDMRGDKTGIPMYPPFERMAKNAMTVSAWKEQRFYPTYPGFDIDVLDGRGEAVSGNTLLSSVRDSYSEE